MFRLIIAEWSYQIGCIRALTAMIYRLLWVVGLSARLPETPLVVPHNLKAVIRREFGKTSATGKAA